MGHYNLVAHSGHFFAIPQSLGPIDLEREDVSGKPGVMIAPICNRWNNASWKQALLKKTCSRSYGTLAAAAQ